MSSNWYEDRGQSIFRLKLTLQPGARKSEIVGLHDDCLKLKVAAPPIEGAANDELLIFIAKALHVKVRHVRIISGHTSRRKVIEVQGVSSENMQSLLQK